MQVFLISLIYSLSPMFNINPKLALAVAKHESKLNPNAIGSHKEVGIFQVRPKYSKFTAKQLRDPITNIKEGLRILAEAQDNCRHKLDYKFIVCFNAGKSGGSRLKYPTKFPYYKKVMQEMALLRLSRLEYSGLDLINERLVGEVQ